MEPKQLNSDMSIPLELTFNENEEGKLESFRCTAATLGKLNLNRVILTPNSVSKDVLSNFEDKGFFLPWTHWSDGVSPVGFAEKASLNGYALLVQGKFHNTPSATELRQVIQERLASNKYVGTSIGARAKMSFWNSGKEYYEFLQENNIDLNYYDLNSFKDEDDYIWVAHELVKLVHVAFTLEPADLTTDVNLEQSAKEFVTAQLDCSRLDLLRLKGRHLEINK